jgi:glycosyltransferase involved in cell wall biosynthesis
VGAAGIGSTLYGVSGVVMFPIIDVFTVAYNEEEIASHFLRHYGFARRIVVYDNESTDRTSEILLADPRVAVRPFSTNGKYDEGTQMEIRNCVWRESNADYVVVVDMDEFVDCHPLSSFGKGEVAFKCEGRSMVGVDGQPLETIVKYQPALGYCKVSVFSPRIEGINFDAGMHVAHPTCPVIENPRLILRHYNNLGVEYMIRRIRRCRDRMSQRNLETGWGIHFTWDDDRIRAIHAEALKSANCIDTELMEMQ